MLRIDQSDTSQDAVLNSLNVAATSYCEAVTKRRFVQQQWTLYLDYFPGSFSHKLAGQYFSAPFITGGNAVFSGLRYAVVLPYPPVQSVTQFNYLNTGGTSTSLITTPVNIASVSNPLNGPVVVTTAAPHNLITNSSVTITGNAPLVTLCGGVASQQVTVLDPSTFVLTFIQGTGTTITGTGSIVGYNFVLDTLTQPARLMPVFGSMFPVSRIVSNAIQIVFNVGYASPVAVSLTAGSGTVGTASFTSANVGQPISVPGAGVNGGCLNTVVNSVAGSVATLRDLPSTSVSTTALLVNYGSPQHWELAKTAIKFLVNSWFVERLPNFNADTSACVARVLGPVMDKRY